MRITPVMDMLDAILLDRQIPPRKIEPKTPLNIKDPATERLARALSAATGEGLTLAVRKAVEERLAKVHRDLGGRDTASEILAIGAQCAALPDLDTRGADDILGYDESDLPT